MGFLPEFNATRDTPQRIADRRYNAALIARQIGQGQPSIGQGIGDIFRGLGAGFSNYRDDQAEQAGNDLRNGQLHSEALADILNQSPQVGMTQPPSNDTVGASIKKSISTGQPPQFAVYTPPRQGQGPDAGLVQPNRPTSMPMPQPAGNAYPGGDGITSADQGGVFDPNTASSQPIPQPSAQPMVPASGDTALIPKIMQVLNNPWVSDSDKAILQKRLETIQQQADPAYQLKMKTDQLQYDQMTHPDQKPLTPLEQAQLDALKAKPQSPTSVQEYEYAKNNGYTGSYTDYKNDVGSDGAPPAKVKEYNFYKQQEEYAGRTPLSYEKFTAMRGASSGASKDDIGLVSQAIINGDQPPETKGLYKNGLAVKAELEKNGFNLSKANQEWQAASKFISSSQGPQQLRVRQNIDALAQSLPHLRELVGQYKAGNYPALNSLMMDAAYQGFTSPEQQSLVNLIRQQISDVQAQTAGVIMGSGSPTDAAFQLAHDQLQANWSQKSIDDALDNMSLNLKYRVNALKNAVPDNNRYVQAPQIAPDAPPPPTAGAPLSDEDLIKKYGG